MSLDAHLPPAATRARAAYAAMQVAGLSPREIEATALERCATRLAAGALALPDDPATFLAALTANQRLWSILAEQARRDDIDVPESERDTLLSLARFVFARTHALAETPDAGRVEPLLAINRRLAAGLRGQPATPPNAVRAD